MKFIRALIIVGDYKYVATRHFRAFNPPTTWLKENELYNFNDIIIIKCEIFDFSNFYIDAICSLIQGFFKWLMYYEFSKRIFRESQIWEGMKIEKGDKRGNLSSRRGILARRPDAGNKERLALRKYVTHAPRFIEDISAARSRRSLNWSPRFDSRTLPCLITSSRNLCK